MDKSLDLQLRELYIRALRLHRQAEALPPDGLLAALSIDSVSMLEISIGVEAKYGIEIAPDDLTANLLDSFEVLARYITDKQAASTIG
ncbi:phosphopantetheine-binding protein [Burkholderia sp. MBR-1]|uniref:phosphopantetheine-binding protein n=1 Tax=Burkholderia sp. MBR-1 TaxID=2732364 RepID=UPI0015EEE41C|nr:phosphopantetheine-binding protein [Burkholderia sp. MBR-1]QMI49020.1 acyl carrier protein [Burkholderia sp. MBR-1]